MFCLVAARVQFFSRKKRARFGSSQLGSAQRSAAHANERARECVYVRTRRFRRLSLVILVALLVVLLLVLFLLFFFFYVSDILALWRYFSSVSDLASPSFQLYLSDKISFS